MSPSRSACRTISREWIEGHFLGLIDAAVRDAAGDERRVELVVREQRPGDEKTTGRTHLRASKD